jgi:hypothetical protein
MHRLTALRHCPTIWRYPCVVQETQWTPIRRARRAPRHVGAFRMYISKKNRACDGWAPDLNHLSLVVSVATSCLLTMYDFHQLEYNIIEWCIWKGRRCFKHLNSSCTRTRYICSPKVPSPAMVVSQRTTKVWSCGGFQAPPTLLKMAIIKFSRFIKHAPTVTPPPAWFSGGSIGGCRNTEKKVSSFESNGGCKKSIGDSGGSISR